MHALRVCKANVSIMACIMHTSSHTYIHTYQASNTLVPPDDHHADEILTS